MRGLNIYKRNQGKYTRVTTFVAVRVLGAWGCHSLTGKLYYLDSAYLQFGIPLMIFVALGFLMFLIVNRPKTTDFFISTEGEMKKVSWSTRKEIIASTKVVIITVIIMAVLLTAVDMGFRSFFEIIGVLKVAPE